MTRLGPATADSMSVSTLTTGRAGITLISQRASVYQTRMRPSAMPNNSRKVANGFAGLFT